jgi:hypothetical protein
VGNRLFWTERRGLARRACCQDAHPQDALDEIAPVNPQGIIKRERAARLVSVPSAGIDVREDEKSIIMTALTTIITLVLFVSTATAQPLPLQKQGPCPSGYRESGGYCSPTSSRAPVAIPKERGQCPSGFMQSGNYCIEMKRRWKAGQYVRSRRNISGHRGVHPRRRGSAAANPYHGNLCYMISGRQTRQFSWAPFFAGATSFAVRRASS